MRIALLQTDIVWDNPSANTACAEDAIKRVFASCPDDAQPELVVLPEMFSTGFATMPDGIAEEWPPKSLDWMKSAAARYGCAIAGSLAIHMDGRCYNRLYFVKPDGECIWYDKKHLFTYGGEHHRFTPGNERKVVEWKGVRFLLTVCYDLRFPIWNRNKGDYDAIICVASWPDVRRLAWDTLTRARAIENQCYMLAVNRTGDDPTCHYNGGTAFINPYGETIAACPDGEVSEIVGDLDMEMLEKYSQKFPVLDDEDAFSLL